MGVHKTEVYPEIKRLLEIPEDEPILIVRAQDRNSPELIDAYIDFIEMDGCSSKFIADMERVATEFADWQSAHSSKVKRPD